MRKFIEIVENYAADETSIKQHMRKCVLAGLHYEGGFNGRKHFTTSPDRDLMADQWYRDRLLQTNSYDDPEFANVLDAWLDRRYDYVVNKLEALPHSHGYELLRVIKVSPEWIDEFSKKTTIALGEYWSYDPDNWEPNAPWANPDMQGFNLTIRAFAPPSGVNWEKTIMANMDFYSGDYESEMRLIPNTVLEIISLDLGNNSRKLNHLGKIFIV